MERKAHYHTQRQSNAQQKMKASSSQANWYRAALRTALTSLLQEIGNHEIRTILKSSWFDTHSERKGCKSSSDGLQGHPKDILEWPKGTPKVSQKHPRDTPKAFQKDPRGSRRRIYCAKGATWAPEVTPRDPKGIPRTAQRPPENIRKTQKILHPARERHQNHESVKIDSSLEQNTWF